MKKILITVILLLGSISAAFATPIIGKATLEGDTTPVGNTIGDYIDYYIPLNDVDGAYGKKYNSPGNYTFTESAQGFGTVSDCYTVGCGSQIAGGTLDMFLYFNIPTGQTGTTLTLDFADLDLRETNDPGGFFESLILEGPLPVGTFNYYTDFDSFADVSYANNFVSSSITFENLSIASGNFWLKLGFQAYSDGLSAGTWCNTSEQLKATLTTAPVPEPATMLLFGTGLIGLAGAYRKKKK